MASNCGWTAVESFKSLGDYERLLGSINEQVTLGQAEERRVKRPYSGLETLDERWYCCRATGETWRLVAPDPPFPGIFDKV
jgi:hypothetical protein